MDICWATNEYGEKVGSSHTSAEITVNNSYLRFSITLYRGCYDAYLKPDGEFELFEILMHEFCHLLTLPFQQLLEENCHESLYPTIKQLSERQTELTSRIMTSEELHKLTKEHRGN
jgi:hypothetical protein